VKSETDEKHKTFKLKQNEIKRSMKKGCVAVAAVPFPSLLLFMLLKNNTVLHRRGPAEYSGGGKEERATV
jgi:hypothetical protein